jgi:hypothetical protein
MAEIFCQSVKFLKSCFLHNWFIFASEQTEMKRAAEFVTEKKKHFQRHIFFREQKSFFLLWMNFFLSDPNFVFNSLLLIPLCCKCYKTVFSSSPMLRKNKLECSSLVSFNRIV